MKTLLSILTLFIFSGAAAQEGNSSSTSNQTIRITLEKIVMVERSISDGVGTTNEKIHIDSAEDWIVEEKIFEEEKVFFNAIADNRIPAENIRRKYGATMVYTLSQR